MERGLVSGGAEGAHDQRTIRVWIGLGDEDWAVLRGTALDDSGYKELLSIAQTIRLRELSHPSAEPHAAKDIVPE